uniref:Endonuclease/exonuclease/phosphatase domain-containing protein n=1 Tax=Labrus bergylta TaxID=56723 RepID=A0A3Q3LII0_9LABR
EFCIVRKQENECVENGNLVYGDKEGRVIVIDCIKERKTFFIEISKWWEGNCVIIGDFNVAMTPTDVSKNNVFKGDVSRGALKDLIITKQCLDIWRLLHPWERAYSRRQSSLKGPFLHTIMAYGHTTLNTPDLVRSRKLSRVGPG